MGGHHPHIHLKAKINARKTGFVLHKPWNACHKCGPGAALGKAGCEHRLVGKQHSHLWLWLSIMSVSWHTVCCHHRLQGLLQSSGRTCIFIPKHPQICLWGPRSPCSLAGQSRTATLPPSDFHLRCRVHCLNIWICSQELSKKSCSYSLEQTREEKCLNIRAGLTFPSITRSGCGLQEINSQRSHKYQLMPWFINFYPCWYESPIKVNRARASGSGWGAQSR